MRGRQRLTSTKRHVSLIEDVKIMAAFYLIHVLSIIIIGGTLNGHTDYMKSMGCVPKHTTLSVICLLTILTCSKCNDIGECNNFSAEKC